MKIQPKALPKPPRPRRMYRSGFKKLSNDITYAGEFKRAGGITVPHGMGSMKFIRLGFTIEGLFNEGSVSGTGCVYFSQGDARDFGQGYFKNSKLNGHGTIVFKENKWYTGEIVDNEITGKGTMYKHGYTFFSGEFLRGEISGEGTMYLFEGWKLSGDFSRGVPEVAKIEYGDDDYYEGEIDVRKMVPNGVGRRFMRTTSEVVSYLGEFREDSLEGRGILKFESSEEYYQGTFRRNLKHGKGSYKFSNGDLYSGDFVDDCIEGLGEMRFANGNVYFGMFSKGNMQGKGRLEFTSETESSKLRVLQYIGLFENNKIQPRGKIFYSDGSSYEGHFLDGKAHGRGTYYYAEEDGGGSLPLQYKEGNLLPPHLGMVHNKLHVN